MSQESSLGSLEAAVMSLTPRQIEERSITLGGSKDREDCQSLMVTMDQYWLVTSHTSSVTLQEWLITSHKLLVKLQKWLVTSHML
jgi:hypothetical protein